MKHIILTTFIFLISLAGRGQSLSMAWDEFYPIGEGAKVNAMIQSVNGWIVVVGEVDVPHKNKNGFFLVIDPLDGSMLFKKDFGGTGEDVLLDVQQAGNGTFYLAGYSDTRGRGQGSAWLLQVDEEGNLLAEKYFGNDHRDRFTHLAVLEDGALLVAGQQGRKHKGEIWISRIEQMNLVNERQIGRGNYENVVGMHRSSSGTVWVGGNLTKKDLERGEMAWMVELDENGNQLTNEAKKLNIYDFGEVYDMKSTVLNNMVLVGTRTKSLQNDAWMIEVDEIGNELLNIPHGGGDMEFGRVLVKTIHDNFFLARRVDRSKSQIVYFDGIAEEAVVFEEEKNFDILDMHYTYRRNLVVAGMSAAQKKGALRIFSIFPEDLLAYAKTESVIECSTAILEDENGDGVLEAGERGAIAFELTNEGNSDLFDGTIEVLGLPPNNNFQTTFFGFLPKGGKKRIRIPIDGDLLVEPVRELTIIVKEQSKELRSFPFEIHRKTVYEDQVKKTQLEVITKWETPYSNSGTHNNIRTRVTSSTITIDHEVFAPYALQSSNYRIKKNGVWLEDHKQQVKDFNSSENEANGRFSYHHVLGMEMELDTGFNEIIIEVRYEGKFIRQDRLLFNYLPEHPNLHVLSIGPATVGLKYNTRDAVDFADLMRAQGTKGYFNEVFVDVLVDSALTTTQRLRMAFEDLKRRYHSNTSTKKIAPEDVLVVFISTHGLVMKEDDKSRFKIMPSDYEKIYEDITSIDYESVILGALRSIDCKKIVLIDACQSGAAGMKSDLPNINKYLLELNSTAPGLLSITSSRAEEASYENDRWQNGAFTKAIKEALDGSGWSGKSGESIIPNVIKTSGGNQLLSIKSMMDYLVARVPHLVKEVNSRLDQNPIMYLDNEQLANIKFLVVPKP